MDMSDVRFVYQSECEIFGKSLDLPMLYDEVIYNQMAHYFIACIDQVRIGYIGCWITEPNAEILNVLVIDKYRKKGVAQALVNHVIALCKKHQVEALTLEVNHNNTSAVQLYLKLGFKTVATRKQYYASGDDALLMMKDLRGD